MLTTGSSQAEVKMHHVSEFFELGCRLEQRCFLFLIINTSGSQTTSSKCQNRNVCSGEVTAAYTNTRMETLVLEMSDKVTRTTNVKQNKDFDKNEGL